ncbi:hypothetical protein L596_001325 [Steinernema carpocapsae]|uniref:EGF-like domain-containing protein n=1 Tax=Steinernema carpocapsae TaxID=34508 RepID=A0A4V6I7D0_STECR|nr:hypothetical protein L596_001325 [Steinernema carpocapsae]
MKLILFVTLAFGLLAFVPGLLAKNGDHHICRLCGGTCVPIRNQTYICVCKVGQTGDDCHEDIDECSTANPCQNNGSCTNLKDYYHCECLEGFFGPNCENEVQDSEDHCVKYGCAEKAGNGICDIECSTLECKWDAFDCDGMHKLYKNCSRPTYCRQVAHDGICNPICNNLDCNFDGRDCSTYVVEDCSPSYVKMCRKNFGNGKCDRLCDRVECGFDGGDCVIRNHNILQLPSDISASRHYDQYKLNGFLAVELRARSVAYLEEHLNDVEMIFNAAARAVFTIGRQANGKPMLESMENVSETQYDLAHEIMKARFRVDTTVCHERHHHDCLRSLDGVAHVIKNSPDVWPAFRFGIHVRNATVEKDDVEELYEHCDPATCLEKYGNGICDEKCSGRGCAWDGGDCLGVEGHPEHLLLPNYVILVLDCSPQEARSNLSQILYTLSKMLYAVVRTKEEGGEIVGWNTTTQEEDVNVSNKVALTLTIDIGVCKTDGLAMWHGLLCHRDVVKIADMINDDRYSQALEDLGIRLHFAYPMKAPLLKPSGSWEASMLCIILGIGVGALLVVTILHRHEIIQVLHHRRPLFNPLANVQLRYSHQNDDEVSMMTELADIRPETQQ